MTFRKKQKQGLKGTRSSSAFSLAAAMVILVHSSSSSGMTNEEFNLRASKAQQKLLIADEIKRNTTMHDELRQRYIFATDGVHAKAKAIFKSSSEWVAGWKNYIDTFNQGNISNYDRYLDESKKFFDKQAVKLEEIASSMEQIRRVATDSQSEMALTFSPSDQLTMQQTSRIRQLQQNHQNLIAAIASISEKSQDKLGELQLIQDTGLKAVTLKIKQRLLKEGSAPLEEAMARYNEMVLRVKLVTPLKKQLDVAAQLMTDLSLNFGYHRAKDLHNKSMQQCNAARQAIQSSTLGDRSKSLSLTDINSVCASIENNWQAVSNSGLGVRDMALEHNALMKLKYQNLCRQRDPAIDCATFKLLSDLNQEFFNTATETDLKDLEYRWSLVEILKP
ncbi:MAG: hypothetical protein ACOVS5_01930 [Oligoflexus sp.]|jgi:hypothetical protein